MQVDVAEFGQQEHPRGNDTSVTYNDDCVGCELLQQRAKFNVVFDFVRLLDAQTVSHRRLFDRRIGEHEPAPLRPIRLSDNQGNVMFAPEQSFQSGNRELRRTAEYELHSVDNNKSWFAAS